MLVTRLTIPYWVLHRRGKKLEILNRWKIKCIGHVDFSFIYFYQMYTIRQQALQASTEYTSEMFDKAIEQ